MVAFIYIMIYNIKYVINYIKKQRNENMLNHKKTEECKYREGLNAKAQRREEKANADLPQSSQRTRR